jgi:FkbM family methyltransferase
MTSNARFRLGRRIGRYLELPRIRGTLRGRLVSYIYRSSNNVGSQLEFYGELEVIRRITSSPNKNWSVIDVGANIGKYAKAWLKSSSEVCVISLEIDPNLSKHLQKSQREYPNRWTVQEFGLSNRSGPISFYSHTAGSEVNSIEKFRGDVVGTRAGHVEKASDFISKEITNQTFLKVDVEGHEYTILHDIMINSDARPSVIQFEFGTAQIYARKSLKDFYEILPDYDIGKVYQGGVDFVSYENYGVEAFGMANIIAVHKSKPEIIDLLRYR